MILAAVGVGLSMYSMYSSFMDGEEEKTQNQINTKEALRRFDLNYDQEMATSNAKLGASGIEMTSLSSSSVLNSIRSEMVIDREFLKQQGVNAEAAISSAVKQNTIKEAANIATNAFSIYKDLPTGYQGSSSQTQQPNSIGKMPDHIQSYSGKS